MSSRSSSRKAEPSAVKTPRPVETPLFDSNKNSVDDEQVVLYALGNFQARGKVLINRELPLDRLRGALKRAAEKFDTDALTDERFAEVLTSLGARVRRVPTFVAKHPFRVIVGQDLAERSRGAHAASED